MTEAQESLDLTLFISDRKEQKTVYPHQSSAGSRVSEW